MTMPLYEPRGPSPAVVWTLIIILVVAVAMILGIFALKMWAEGHGESVSDYSLLITGGLVTGGLIMLSALLAHDAGVPPRR